MVDKKWAGLRCIKLILNVNLAPAIEGHRYHKKSESFFTAVIVRHDDNIDSTTESRNH